MVIVWSVQNFLLRSYYNKLNCRWGEAQNKTQAFYQAQLLISWNAWTRIPKPTGSEHWKTVASEQSAPEQSVLMQKARDKGAKLQLLSMLCYQEYFVS